MLTVAVPGTKVRLSLAFTVTCAGTAVGDDTVMTELAVAVTPSRVSDAVMVAGPGAIDVTIPAASTSAFVRSLVVKVAPVTPPIAALRASRAVATNGVVVPIATAAVPGVSASVANLCATSTGSVAETAPLAPVIVAEPLPTAVTVALLPEPVTVATDALFVDQVTVAFAITF